MSSLLTIYKNYSKIFNFSKAELGKKCLKSLSNDSAISVIYRGTFYNNILFYGKINSFVCIRNQCLFTGKSRGIIKNIHLGRHIYKKIASGGFLNGVSKSTW